MGLYYLIYDDIENVRKALKELPYSKYGLVYFKPLNNQVYLGFETNNDAAEFEKNVAKKLADVNDLIQEDFFFMFSPIQKETITEGNERLLKFFAAEGRRQ